MCHTYLLIYVHVSSSVVAPNALSAEWAHNTHMFSDTHTDTQTHTSHTHTHTYTHTHTPTHMF